MAAHEFNTLMASKRNREVSETQSFSKKKDDKSTPDKMIGGASGGGEEDLDFPDIGDDQFAALDAQIKSAEAAADGGGGNSYANAAKKSRKDFLYALYITAGGGESEDHPRKLTSAHFLALEEAMFDAKLTMAKNELDLIRIEWSHHLSTYGIVAALDEHTQHWVRSIATRVTHDDVKLLVSARWQRAEAWECQGFLTGLRWKTQNRNFRFKEFLKLNKIEGQYFFTITKWDICKNGVYTIFQPHGDLLKILKDKNRMDSNSGTFYPKWRLRKSMTKEEFLEKRGVKKDNVSTEK